MCSHVRHVEVAQHPARGLGIVVGRPADQREAGEVHNRINHHLTAMDEEFLDRGA